MQDVAVGFRCHSGWAVMVTVTGSAQRPLVLDRRRVDLVPVTLPRQPYHAVAEEDVPPGVIAEVEQAASRAAAAALDQIGSCSTVGIVAADRLLPERLDDILRVHARLHAAEGALYERAVIDAASSRGLSVHMVSPDQVRVSREVDSLRQSVGSPWQKDHKWAASVAFVALDR